MFLGRMSKNRLTFPPTCGSIVCLVNYQRDHTYYKLIGVHADQIAVSIMSPLVSAGSERWSFRCSLAFKIRVEYLVNYYGLMAPLGLRGCLYRFSLQDLY